MRLSHWIAALACMGIPAASTSASDLTKIERKITREPAYASQPKYCLSVFGPDAEARVWLVLDGDALYVDRNGNGDLTEDGERLAAKKDADANADDGSLRFVAGELGIGKLTHKNFWVSVQKLDYLAEQNEQVKDFLGAHPQARGYSVGVEVEMPNHHGIGVGGRVQQLASVFDAHGLLAFADKPEDAPIIHFGGPWQITLYGPQGLTAGRTGDLVLGVGTPGLGAGTTAFVGYEGVIPEMVYPKVEITYPSARPEDAPAKELYELKQRC